jgi:hypothetical protein
MAVAPQLSWLFLLTGAALLWACTLRNPLAALLTGGLLGLACISIAVIHTAADW